MKILWFILMLAVGFSAVYFALPLFQITGRMEWIEEHLGQGQTITFWRLLGAAIIIFAFIYLVYF